ncbi:MAG: hypothetical protein LBK62_04210 [Treponema sp.]|jgi:hypothetical protein|nr:hypothetical protein [Treponema sp.]
MLLKKNKPQMFLAVFFMAAALTFITGCEKIVDSLQPNVVNDTGGLSDEELDSLLNPGGSGDTIFDPIEIADPSGKTYILAPGTGTLKSQGRAIGTGTATYYLDFENGDDANNGLSPLNPWKSFKNVNATTFRPGDHILLEADSIWNGESVTLENKDTLLDSGRAGILYPKGNGANGKPIVIDLYDIDDFDAQKPAVYLSANKRPLINGNGTPSTGSDPYHVSGAIHLMDQHHWEIYNIECTNTFDNFLTEPNHWYKKEVRKMLSGILITGTINTINRPEYKHVVVKNCYVHDVQSENTNNGASAYTSDYFTGATHTASNVLKVVGGIIIGGNLKATPDGVASQSRYYGYDDVLLEGNIVRKVGLEGLRTKSEGNSSTTASPFKNVVIRGNYIEYIAGDGIVLSDVQSGGLVESNIIKDSCAAPNLGTANYAGVWAWYARTDCLFQYNECYGTVYGYQDGEAWDIDNNCQNVVYQYNYSHHNAGGVILFMNSGVSGSVFRYNISANDGGSTRYMANVTNGVDPTANSYTAWSGGQTLFHYTPTNTSANALIPLIYNNTFYMGDGVTCGVFGHNATTAVNKYVRFYNNILLKVGAGTVYLSYGHSGSGNPGRIFNPAGFKKNLLWGYETDQNTGDQSKFSNGDGATIAELCSPTYENIWQNPGLKIQDPANVTALRTQRDDGFPESSYTDPEALAAFTGKERLRSRAGIFSPAAATSPVINAGMEIPIGASSLDGAWNNRDFTGDFFDRAVNKASPPIGAASAPY